MNIFYKVKVQRKKGDKTGMFEFLVPVEVVEDSVVQVFGRKDCRIKPIGGKGEVTVDYHKLIVES